MVLLRPILSWDHHGEKINRGGHYDGSQNHVIGEDDDMYDAFEILRDIGEQYKFNNVEEEPNKEAANFYKLVNDAFIPLYPNCEEHSKLSFVTKLLHFKNMYGCSQKGLDELLKLIGSVLPSPHTLPETYQNVKNKVRGLHLKYEKIDACENDCMLFYKEDADQDKLVSDICGADRYKVQKNPKKARVAKKVLRYFPLTPRLQRLFMSKHTTEYMRWHKTRNVIEGQISHPADGDEWKQFDRRFPSFENESQNVRLGLATDGFQPFHDKHSRGYSVWPIFIVVYNLPPSMCMKDQFIIMPLIIPENRDPTKDLNVYLRPLIDELKILWNTGVTTFDKSLHSNFVMKATLLWTISDFPAYGMLSGWSTYGRMSCPICLGDVRGFQLKHGGKVSYYGTSRVFLEPNDPLRKNNKYGSRETRSVKTRYSGTAVKNYCKCIKFYPHGKIKWRKPEDFGVTHNWTHMSMFWELPYWETLQLRHYLDVMYIENNVFDNIFHTILDNDKTKDKEKSRKDCEHLKIRNELWIHPDGTIPQAPYALTRDKVDKLCKWVKELELPDGCSSNIAHCCKEDKRTLKGMKSHDCHVFLQKLIPIMVPDLLPKSIGDAIIELCNFFKDLCSTSLRRHDLEKMEKDMVKILCKLELIVTPGFFDLMEHLPIHLAMECMLGGPVQYRWMYVFERYLHKVKLTVKNKACVEGSMAERYIEEELTNFCSLYFESDVATLHNRLQRNDVPQ
ncbi:uncharacterized protein LOC141661233 [Apium graveolens]|uniref:uncharacterized protein LOC141661233 n=1 Tax=Apium graveolens TaxID=4045 RepID=UPI003D7A3C72